MTLEGKTVLLGVTGSIAAYKIAYLASALKKRRADVHVLMTKNATNFINPITFETLTGNKCLVDTFDRNFQFQVEHVSIAKKADVVIIAPASANVIGKLAHGIADDMLTTTIMACKCKKFISPAMNTNMFENPVVQDNLKILEHYGYEVIAPASGYLACGDTGAGKMPEPETLLAYIEREAACEKDLKGKKIAVGPSGSVAGDAMKTIMDAYGYEINKDWSPEYLSHGDGAEALTDGNVDAVCIMSTLPASPVATAAASKELRLLDLDQEQYDKIMEACPYYLPATIEANVYNGQDEPVERTFGSASLMVSCRDLSDDDAYAIAKALFENNDTLVAAYPQCDEGSLENATRGLDGQVEMHPGVVKYLKEVGAMK